MIYSTNFFQANFLPEKYYKRIFEGQFDVSKKGELIKIPIKYKYKTEYSLLLTVPDRESIEFNNEKGVLHYQFISNGRVLNEGETFCPAGATGYGSYQDNFISAVILNFNLPYPEADKDLTLVLQAVNPMSSLVKYSGKIRCSIRPASMK